MKRCILIYFPRCWHPEHLSNDNWCSFHYELWIAWNVLWREVGGKDSKKKIVLKKLSGNFPADATFWTSLVFSCQVIKAKYIYSSNKQAIFVEWSSKKGSFARDSWQTICSAWLNFAFFFLKENFTSFQPGQYWIIIMINMISHNCIHYPKLPFLLFQKISHFYLPISTNFH